MPVGVHVIAKTVQPPPPARVASPAGSKPGERRTCGRAVCAECRKPFVKHSPNQVVCDNPATRCRARRMARVHREARQRRIGMKRTPNRYPTKEDLMPPLPDRSARIACRRCDRMFDSEDKIFNRICDECKKSAIFQCVDPQLEGTAW